MLRLSRPLISTVRPSQSTSRSLITSLCAMASQPLTAQKCEPCTAALPAMSQDEATQLLSSLKGKWSLSPQPKTLLSSKATHPDALHRTYKFKDWKSAQAFANQLGALAEMEGHHPAIMVEWGRVTVWWWSHAINGVSMLEMLVWGRKNANPWWLQQTAAQERLCHGGQDRRAGSSSRRIHTAQAKSLSTLASPSIQLEAIRYRL